MRSAISSRPTTKLTKHEKDDVLGMLGRIEKATSRPYSYGQSMPRSIETKAANVINPAQRAAEVVNNVISKSNKPIVRKTANGFPEEFYDYFEIELDDDTPPPAQGALKLVS